MTPTQRTLKALRELGYRAEVVEYWQPSHSTRAVVAAAQSLCNATVIATAAELRAAVAELERTGPGKRKDLFGWIDIEAITRREKIATLGKRRIGIQCTTTENMSARITKIQTERAAEALDWLHNDCEIEVWGWKKYSKKENGKLWRPTVKRLVLASNGGISVESE